jgi:hypothetical protein
MEVRFTIRSLYLQERDDPGTGLDTVEKRKSLTLPGIEPQFLSLLASYRLS